MKHIWWLLLVVGCSTTTRPCETDMECYQQCLAQYPPHSQKHFECDDLLGE